MAIERYRTIAPELLTINPIKNKMLSAYNIQNTAYGFLYSDLKLIVNNKPITVKSKTYVSNEANSTNIKLDSVGNGRINGLINASEIKYKKPFVVFRLVTTSKVVLPGLRFKKWFLLTKNSSIN